MKVTQNLTDEALVELYRHGDQSAFEALLLRHKDRVFSYILTIVKDRDLAEDIFQETFIKIVITIKNGRYVDSGRFGAWVARIAHNLIIDHYRRLVNERTVSNDDYEYDLLNNTKLADSNHEEFLIQEQILHEVVKLIDMLPDNQQEIVRLRFYENMSFKEIADLKQISINTALGRMRYAVLNLRKIATSYNLLSDFERIA